MSLRRGVYRQQGGTTAGLIIGLIIGLLIALGIAMTIMRTPLPFIDKIGKPSQSAGDLGDPNKSLQSSARESRDAAANTTAAPPAPPPDAAVEPKRPATPAATARQNEKPATSPAPVAEPAPSAGSGGFTYYLQAGAFRERQDAEATKARLALMGVAATIAERKSDMGTLYRVRVGPFDDVEGMNRARVRMSDNGVDAAVVRVPK
jgi:cell division protein FtsN